MGWVWAGALECKINSAMPFVTDPILPVPFLLVGSGFLRVVFVFISSN